MRGPLNVARSPQGRPVMVQAGASDVGQDLAAAAADVVFATAQDTIKAGRASARHARRAGEHGRATRTKSSIMPGLPAHRRPSQRRREEKFDGCDPGRPRRSASPRRDARPIDLFGYPLDGPLPEITRPTRATRAREAVRRDGQAREPDDPRSCRRLAAAPGIALWGTPQRIADQIEEWFEAGACRRLQCDVALSARGA